MCAGAILQSRIPQVFFGARDPKGGAMGGVLDLFWEDFNHRPQVVTGVLTPDAGRVDLKGSRVAQFTPNGFILESVSHIPEDRNKMGLIGDMSVQENIVLKSTGEPQFSRAKGWLLKKKAIRDYADINVHVHLCDNNRRYPGNCGLDFEKIIQTFHDVGYDDLYSTEVFQFPSMEECAKRSIAYLAPIFQRVYGREPRV